MYCNSCSGIIRTDDLVYCSQCHVPLHKSCANKCMECGKILCDSCFAENNYKCEECFKPNNKFEVIRRSHLEQYAGCPYSLYLQLVLGVEPPMGGAAQLGVIVHELIDKEESDLITSLQEAQNQLISEVKEWNDKLPSEDDYSYVSSDLLDNGMKCLNNFWLVKDNFKESALSEYNIKFSIQDELPQVSCTLDRIIQKDNEIYIHDWKTGKPMSGKKLVTDLQPPLYMYGVYKEFGKLPKSFTLHYLREPKIITYNKIGEWDYEVKTTRSTYKLNILEAIDRTVEILKSINNNEFNMPNEKSSWRCKRFCWFYSSGKCESSFNESWRKLSDR